MVISGLIKNGDDIIGIISMEHEKPYAYKAEEKEMLLTSIAIISTFLVKKYQEKEKNQYNGSCRTRIDSYSDDYFSCALLYLREKSVCRNRCFTAGY